MTSETLENLNEEVEEVEEVEVLEFEIVPNSLRAASRNHFFADEMANALLEDKTIKVPKDFIPHRLYRWARDNGYKLRSKSFTGTDYKIIWFERINVKEESKGD